MPKQTKTLRELAAIPLAAISGLALAYALPPSGVSILGWVALSPLLLASRLLRPVYAAGLGLITAFVAGLTLADGHWRELHQLGNLVGAFGGLGAVLAFASCAASVGAKRMTDGRWMLFVACAGVTAELLSWLAFPVTTAISQHQNPAALRVASIAGVWGVSFLLWLAQAAFAVVASKPRVALAGITSAMLVLGAAYLIPDMSGPPRVVYVGAVQGGSVEVPSLTTSLPAGSLVVWPEFLAQSGDRTPEDSARRGRLFLAASFREPARPRPHNSCRLISTSGRTLGVFRKQHLFGREKLEFSPGELPRPVSCGGVPVGVAICYDTEFTDVVRGLVRDGARIVLVPNHDPEMPNRLFNYLHAAVIPFRAAENGVPIVWAETNALSMVLGPDGRIIAQAAPGKVGVVRAEVPLRPGKTIYTRIGDVFAHLCGVGFLLPLIAKPETSAPSESRRWIWRP